MQVICEDDRVIAGVSEVEEGKNGIWIQQLDDRGNRATTGYVPYEQLRYVVPDDAQV